MLLAACAASPREPAPSPAVECTSPAIEQSKPCQCNYDRSFPCDGWVVVRFAVSSASAPNGRLTDPVAAESCGDETLRAIAVEKAAQHAAKNEDKLLEPGKEPVEILLKFNDCQIEFWGRGQQQD